MSFWSGRSAAASNLRQFHPVHGWRKYADSHDAEGRISFTGSARDIDFALTSALNASNLLLLTGAGSSFCAANPPGHPSAPGMADLWDAVEAKVTVPTLEKMKALIPTAAGIGKNIEKLMTLSKLYVSLFADKNSREMQHFIVAAELAILSRVDFVTSTTNLDHHGALIRKIARRGARKPRARIFTTNYDLCFEYAAQNQQFVVVDGFSHSVPQVYDRAHYSYDIVRRGNPGDAPNYIENVFHLYKLHGSLDWRRGTNSIIRSKSPEAGAPVLIYPRDTKYQEAFEAPYLDMMGAFQTALREPDTALIVSGFGFNDDHISKPIIAALEANLSLRLVICDVAFIDDQTLALEPETISPNTKLRSQNPYFERFLALSRFGDLRIVLLSGRFDDLAAAIPDLVAQTERERHAERISGALQSVRTGDRL